MPVKPGGNVGGMALGKGRGTDANGCVGAAGAAEEAVETEASKRIGGAVSAPC